LSLLDAPEVIDASADTRWGDRVRDEGRLVAEQHLGIALAAAAIDGYEQAEAVERTRLWLSGRGGRPHVQHEVGAAIELKLRDRGYKVIVARTGATGYGVRIHSGEETHSFDVTLDRLDAHAARMTVAGRGYRLVTAIHGPTHLVEVDGVTHRVSRD